MPEVTRKDNYISRLNVAAIARRGGEPVRARTAPARTNRPCAGAPPRPVEPRIPAAKRFRTAVGLNFADCSVALPSLWLPNPTVAFFN